MKHIILLSNKGGNARTTTASVIASALGHSICLDWDPSQCNLTRIMGGDKEHEPDLYSALTNKSGILDAIQHGTHGDVITGSPLLVNLKITPKAMAGVLATLTPSYEYAIHDTSPTLTPCILSLLSNCDYCVITLQADLLSIQGAAETLELVKEYKNLKVAGLLLVRYNERALVRRAMREAAEKLTVKFKTRLFTAIRESVIIPEAQTMGNMLFDYDNKGKSKATQDYRAFVHELLEFMEGDNGKEKDR